MNGTRGDSWVIGQSVLLVAYALTPRIGRWGLPLRLLGWTVGLPLLVTGLIFFGYGIVTLGGSLTPFPKPKADGSLVTEGIYACVRHPIYGGLVMAALGWGLLRGSVTKVLSSLVLLGFFGAKSGREEEWLVEQYPDYPSYQARVRRMLPGIW